MLKISGDGSFEYATLGAYEIAEKFDDESSSSSDEEEEEEEE